MVSGRVIGPSCLLLAPSIQDISIAHPLGYIKSSSLRNIPLAEWGPGDRVGTDTNPSPGGQCRGFRAGHTGWAVEVVTPILAPHACLLLSKYPAIPDPALGKRRGQNPSCRGALPGLPSVASGVGGTMISSAGPVPSSQCSLSPAQANKSVLCFARVQWLLAGDCGHRVSVLGCVGPSLHFVVVGSKSPDGEQRGPRLGHLGGLPRPSADGDTQGLSSQRPQPVRSPHAPYLQAQGMSRNQGPP